jgi:putative SOS response-associated peptidase YedK
MINARAETLRSKPAFKEAVVARRCLVPADGFYEWVKEASGKVPYWIHDPDRAPLSLAGLWERWEGGGREAGPPDPGGEPGGTEPVYSFTIITVEPNDAVRPLHDRMPAIVAARERSTWLDRSVRTENALEILRPYEGELAAYPVSKLVNSPANDVAECIEPV